MTISPSRAQGRFLTLTELFSEVLDISAVPSRALLYGLSLCATDPAQRTLLAHISADMHGLDNEYAVWARTRSMSLVDVLEEFPSVSPFLSPLLSWPGVHLTTPPLMSYFMTPFRSIE